MLQRSTCARNFACDSCGSLGTGNSNLAYRRPRAHQGEVVLARLALSLNEGRGWMHTRGAISPNQAFAGIRLPKSREAPQIELMLIFYLDSGQ